MAVIATRGNIPLEDYQTIARLYNDAMQKAGLDDGFLFLSAGSEGGQTVYSVCFRTLEDRRFFSKHKLCAPVREKGSIHRKSLEIPSEREETVEFISREILQESFLKSCDKYCLECVEGGSIDSECRSFVEAPIEKMNP